MLTFTTLESSLLLSSTTVVSVELVELSVLGGVGTGEVVGSGTGEDVDGTGEPCPGLLDMLTSGLSQSTPMGAAEVRMVKRVKMRTATVKVKTERDIVARLEECGMDRVTGDQNLLKERTFYTAGDTTRLACCASCFCK